MGGLDFAAVVDYGAGAVNEGLQGIIGVNMGSLEYGDDNVLVHLCDIQAPTCSLTVPEDHQHPCFLDRGSDPVHFWRVLDKRVRHVLVDKLGIVEDRLCPDTPVVSSVKSHRHGTSRGIYMCLPGIAGNEDFRKAQDVGAILASFFDERNDLFHGAL